MSFHKKLDFRTSWKQLISHMFLNSFILFLMYVWLLLELEVIFIMLVEDHDRTFKFLIVADVLKTARDMCWFSVHQYVTWRQDNKNILILKNIVFTINKNMLILQACNKEFKSLKACFQCQNELNSFACCVINDQISFSLNLKFCVNC